MKSAQACTGVEIIVADGRSSDGTDEVAKGLGARLLTITGGVLWQQAAMCSYSFMAILACPVDSISMSWIF
jgi:hypothetical protein